MHGMRREHVQRHILPFFWFSLQPLPPYAGTCVQRLPDFHNSHASNPRAVQLTLMQLLQTLSTRMPDLTSGGMKMHSFVHGVQRYWLRGWCSI